MTKYRIHGKIPKEEYDKMKAEANKSVEQKEVERIFNVDLSKKKTKTVMGVEFTEEELENMQQPFAEEEPFQPVSYDAIEDQYVAEQLGLEIDENGDLVVPKKNPKKRGVFF